ncbi:MAG: polysaccharide deacetylase family protein [Agriterribacter sp.]
MNVLQLCIWAICLLSPPHTTQRAKNLSKEIPVLCYHNVLSKVAVEGDLWIDSAGFDSQIRSLKDSGYATILPEDLYRHTTLNEPLPAKPVIITFDDSHSGQATIAALILQRYGFRAVFFIMTVTIGKPGYLSVAQIRELSRAGHCIASHSYDHPLVTTVSGTALHWQFYQSKKTLESVTGKEVLYAAYPYGVWNQQTVDTLKNLGYRAAFQLSGRQSTHDPLYTLRRMIASGTWPPAELHRHIRSGFRFAL